MCGSSRPSVYAAILVSVGLVVLFSAMKNEVASLVRSILETGSFLGIKTVAGFVEDAETLMKLAEMGVDCVQGYLIGEPRPLESLA